MLADLFFDYLLLSIPFSLIIVILILCSGFLHKRYEIKWSYWIWMILAVRLLLPFNFSFEERMINIPMPEIFKIESVTPSAAPVESFAIEPAPADISVPAPTASVQTVEPVGQVVEQTANRTISWFWMDVLVWIWSAGVITILLYHFIGYFIFKKQAWRWSWNYQIGNGQKNAIIKQVFKEMKVKKQIPMRISEKVPNPMLVGFIKPVLFLPDRSYTAEELEFTLKHELVHFKRRDILYKLLLVLVKSIHWFNPIVWLMVREAQREIEISCDAKVIEKKSLTYRKRYCEAILSLMESDKTRGGFGLTTNFSGTKRDLKRRFMNALTIKQRKNGIVPFLISLLLIGLITLFSGSMNLTAQGNAEIFNEEKNQNYSETIESSQQNDLDYMEGNSDDEMSFQKLSDEDNPTDALFNDDLVPFQQIPLTFDDMKVGNIQIDDTSDSLIKEFGEPTKKSIVHANGAPEWIYDKQGFSVFLEPVWGIRVTTSFLGSTPRGITIGSTEDEVKEVYPDLEIMNNNFYQRSTDKAYYINFEIENGIVKSIFLQKDLAYN